MLRLLLGFAALLVVVPADTARASSVVFPSTAFQGALVFGKVPPGSRVEYAGRDLRVTAYGTVVLGVGRDEQGPLTVAVHSADGLDSSATITVTARHWPTEIVNGVPPKTVDPPHAIAERIRREQARVTAERSRDDARTDFAQIFVRPVQGRISGRFGNQRVYNGKAGSGHSG
ncbi:MAG: M23 family peptidase, partial [Dokdonella sp.]